MVSGLSCVVPLAALLALMAGPVWAATSPGSSGGGALNPPVSFLEHAPTIDGLLDPALASLPERSFPIVEGATAEAPPQAHYRLAYGAGFFYVYVECRADSLTFRDRAYQNGDGFHMVLCVPRPGDEPTDEFYVLACSAVDRPDREWSRRVIWYYNVDHLFQKLSADAKLEFAAKDGKIGFEFLLPWQDVHPYHPWLSDAIGFNLRFVKAVPGKGEAYGKIEYMVVADRAIDSEQHPRMYARLRFEPPAVGAGGALGGGADGGSAGSQTFALPERNHIVEGDLLRITAASIGASFGAKEDLGFCIKSGEGTRVARADTAFTCDAAGITRSAITIDTSELPAGGYRIEWSSRVNSGHGETGLTIMPAVDLPALETRLERIEGAGSSVSPGSATTILFYLEELRQKMAALRPYETAADERVDLSRVLRLIDRAESGDDVLASRTGFFRRAFRSKVDGTMQPYGIRVPAGFDRGRTYPLIVYLHGSGSDETDLGNRLALSPPGGGFIEICPRARGTSNAYTADHAQEDVAEAIDDAMRNYPVDAGRIILTGFSMGGYGVYRTFYETPRKFRALAIFSGDPEIGNKYTGRTDQPSFTDPKCLARFAGMPVFIFHGQQDRNCPYELTEQVVGKLRAAGASVDFETDPNLGHQMPGADVTAAYYRWLDGVLAGARRAPASIDRTTRNVDRAGAEEKLDPAAEAAHWRALGLVDVHEIDSTLVVRLKYATADNFMGKNVYGSLTTCWLQKEAAVKLARANALLKARDPGLRILVADGMRPLRIQRLMWDLVRGTPNEPYVASPESGSMHNYGVAVDVTLVGTDGVMLDMGTPMDAFSLLARPREEDRLLREGRLTARQVASRRLLRAVMTKAGFRSLGIEWWHFDAFDKVSTRRRFLIVP